MLSIIINILLFILVIGVLTLVHELGHFIAAKLVKAEVEEFSIGFGPKLLSKKYKETLYCIRILPLGGYVKILGDGDPQSPKESKEFKDNPRSLGNKSRIAQAFVMLAGITMNLLFAVTMYYIVLAGNSWKMNLDWAYENFKPTGAQISKEVVGNVEYSELVDGGNAQLAKLPTSGTIQTINGVSIIYSNQVGEELKKYKGQKVVLNICNDSCEDYNVQVSEKGTIGILLSTNYYVTISYENSKVFAGFSHLINTLRLISTKFGALFSQAEQTGDYTELSNSVSGPVGIYFLIDYFKNLGVITFLSVMGDLSLSLAVMNILPIPALDGGRVLILLIESIFRHSLNEKVKVIIINGSFIFLMLLVVLIMVKDIANIQNIRDMFK